MSSAEAGSSSSGAKKKSKKDKPSKKDKTRQAPCLGILAGLPPSAEDEGTGRKLVEEEEQQAQQRIKKKSKKSKKGEATSPLTSGSASFYKKPKSYMTKFDLDCCESLTTYEDEHAAKVIQRAMRESLRRKHEKQGVDVDKPISDPMKSYRKASVSASSASRRLSALNSAEFGAFEGTINLGDDAQLATSGTFEHNDDHNDDSPPSQRKHENYGDHEIARGVSFKTMPGAQCHLEIEGESLTTTEEEEAAKKIQGLLKTHSMKKRTSTT